MKTKIQIEQELGKCKALLFELKEKYYDLCQIDMLSLEGNKLDEEINQLKGEIKAYNWILKN